MEHPDNLLIAAQAASDRAEEAHRRGRLLVKAYVRALHRLGAEHALTRDLERAYQDAITAWHAAMDEVDSVLMSRFRTLGLEPPPGDGLEALL